MMMSHVKTVTLMKKRVYRLGTKTVEMPGGGMDVNTVGPDNQLRLVVTVEERTRHFRRVLGPRAAAGLPLLVLSEPVATTAAAQGP
jgi:hypothetical protein